MANQPRTAVLSLREVRTAPYYAHGFHLAELFGTVFEGSTHFVRKPSSRPQQLALDKGRGLGLARRFPGRACLDTVPKDLQSGDLLFVMAHDMGDLDLLFSAGEDWMASPATKVLVLIEVWSNDAARFPECFSRVVSAFDAVFCTLEEGIPALTAATGKDVQCLAQAVDVLSTPWNDSPSIDVLTIGRRSPSQHDLFERWSASRNGWYQYDTLPVGGVKDVDAHRFMTAQLIARSAISVCNFARFDHPERIGATRGTGTRFFESVAGGAVIAGELPTDQMFTDEFAGLPGIAPLPLNSDGLDLDRVDELVRLGRDPEVRRTNRAHALGRQDLAHRIRQILGYIDVAEPTLLIERFARLEQERREVLNGLPATVVAGQ